MPDISTCAKCGTTNSGAGGFCQKCGAPLVAAQAAPPMMTPQMPPATVTSYAVAPSFGVQVYGGFWIRLVALLVDRLVIGAVAVPIFVVMVLPSLVKLIHDAQRNNEPA